MNSPTNENTAELEFRVNYHCPPISRQCVSTDDLCADVSYESWLTSIHVRMNLTTTISKLCGSTLRAQIIWN
jgi:hypothetical protein